MAGPRSASGYGSRAGSSRPTRRPCAMRFAHGREEPARDPRTARRGDRAVEGVFAATPWRGHRLGGGELRGCRPRCSARLTSSRIRRGDRGLRGDDARRDGQAARRRALRVWTPQKCPGSAGQAGGAGHGSAHLSVRKPSTGCRPGTIPPAPGRRGKAAIITSPFRLIRPAWGQEMLAARGEPGCYFGWFRRRRCWGKGSSARCGPTTRHCPPRSTAGSRTTRARPSSPTAIQDGLEARKAGR